MNNEPKVMLPTFVNDSVSVTGIALRERGVVF